MLSLMYRGAFVRTVPALLLYRDEARSTVQNPDAGTDSGTCAESCYRYALAARG